MPRGSLVVAFFRGKELIIPSGDDRAQNGDDALILCTSAVLDQVERMITTRPRRFGTMMIAGGGATGVTVAEALVGRVERVRLIERDRGRATALAAQIPEVEVLHGDATDPSLLKSERVHGCHAFVAVTGNDESNLMASLLVQELGVQKVVALVDRTETSHVWRKLGLMRVVSPRAIATLGNIGPGLAEVGPTESFAFFSSWQKLLMVLLMWLGRLEVYAIAAVLAPRFWRR